MKLKFGTQTMLTYFIVFYATPAVISIYFGFHRNFVELQPEWNTVLLLIVFLVSWLIFYLVFTLLIGNVKFSIINIFRLDLTWLTLSVLSVLLGVYFFVNFGLEYRQTGERLSDSGFLVQLVYLIKPLVFSYVFYTFFEKTSGNSIGVRRILILLFFLIFWMLTVTSSFEFLLLGLLSIFLLSKKIFNTIFYPDINFHSTRGLRDLFLILCLGPILVFGIIFIGIANKTGLDGALPYIFEGEGLSKTAYYIYYRLSIFYHAFIFFSENHLLSWSLYDKSLSVIVDSWNYRTSLIFGLEVDRPHLTNLNRMVYEMIYSSPKDKEIGASPGYLASFIMFIPAYMAMIVAGTYTALLHLILNKAGSRIQRFSPIAILLVIYFLFPFLHNPVHSFLTIGPEAYKALIYLYVLVVLSNQKNSEGSIYG
jgi:hypothetical protein